MRILRSLGRSGFTGLMIFFGLLAVVCLTLPFSLGSSSLGSSVSDHLTESADLTAQAIGSQVSNLTAQVETAAGDERLLGASASNVKDPKAPVRQMIDDLRSSNPSIRTAGFLDASGTMLIDSPLSTLTGMNLSFRPYFAGPKDDPTRTYVSDPFTARLSGAPILISVSKAVMAPAVQGQPPQIVGVLVAGMEVDATLGNYLSTFETSRGIEVSLFDSNANKIISSGVDGLSDRVFLADVVAATSNGFDYQTLRTSSDDSFIYALREVPSSDFVVAVTASKDDAYGPLESFQQRMFLIGGIGGSGMLLGLFLLARSLKARDRAIREVRINGERTRVIIETAAEAFVECNERGQVTAWNKAAVAMFGWTSDEAIGSNILDLITPDGRRDDAKSELLSMFEEDGPMGTTVKGERPVVRRGQKMPFPAALTVWRTELNGEKRLSFFFEDITERRQLEAARELVFRRQRELVEELRRADQAKNDFMSTVSHELRTPLTSIVGYLEMLKEGYGGTFNKQGTSMVDVIDRNAQRLLHLIEDLLTLSRIESGVERTITSLVDVRFLAMQVQQALVPQAKERKISVELDVQNGLPLLQGDANQLERVLINLMTNAIKFTPEGGEVGLKGWLDNDLVHLEVRDNGMGIPADEQKKLFSRFFRSTDAQSQAIQGTGLGLVIVKSIIERHGGTIALESEYGVGTTVSFTLPVAQESETAKV